MKTPRDLLLHRHRSAARQLASSRRQALLETLSPSRPLWWRILAIELVVPSRGGWIALAAAWLVILSFHFITPAPTAGQTTRLPAWSGEEIAVADAAVTAGLDSDLAAQLNLPTFSVKAVR